MLNTIESKDYYKILDSVTKVSNINDMKMYRSPYSINEKKILNGLDKIANKVAEYKSNNVGFLNLSLIEIFKNTSTTVLEVINEIPILFEKQNDDYERWWIKYTNKLKGILVILTKKDRLIYLGILLIFLSIVIYFIEISS